MSRGRGRASENSRAWLELAENAAKALRDATETREYLRDEFIGIVHAAKIANATQQEIADATGYSRQRIQQFLDQKKKQTSN